MALQPLLYPLLRLINLCLYANQEPIQQLTFGAIAPHVKAVRFELNLRLHFAWNRPGPKLRADESAATNPER